MTSLEVDRDIQLLGGTARGSRTRLGQGEKLATSPEVERGVQIGSPPGNRTLLDGFGGRLPPKGEDYEESCWNTLVPRTGVEPV